MIEMSNEAEFTKTIQQVNAALATTQARDLFVDRNGVAIVRNLLKKCSSKSPTANIVALLSLVQTCAHKGNCDCDWIVSAVLKIHSSIFPCVFYVC